MPQSQRAYHKIMLGRMLPGAAVDHLSGVNAIMLRTWERRYNLIRPRGTAKGHRLYTEDKLELIRNTTVPVFVGGATVTSHQKTIEAAGTICLGEAVGKRLKKAKRRLNIPRRH